MKKLVSFVFALVLICTLVSTSCCSVVSHSVFTLDSAQVKHMHYEKSDTIHSSYKK